MTPAQARFFAWLRETTHLIPVTARSRAELARVTLDFDSWKIAAHGALVLRPDGETDPVWRDRLVPALRAGAAAIRTLHRQVSRWLPRLPGGQNSGA